VKKAYIHPVFWLYVPIVIFGLCYLFSLPSLRLWWPYVHYREQGAVEWLQNIYLVLFIVTACLTYIKWHRRLSFIEKCFVLFMALGGFVILGEELSWGQHLFMWKTPEWMVGYNAQNETNLHNMSSWFNHKPTYILEAGIFITVLIRPVWSKIRPTTYIEHDFWPGKYCIPSAFLVFMPAIIHGIQKSIGMFITEGLYMPNITSYHEIEELFIYSLFFIYGLEFYGRKVIELDDRRMLFL